MVRMVPRQLWIVAATTTTVFICASLVWWLGATETLLVLYIGGLGVGLSFIASFFVLYVSTRHRMRRSSLEAPSVPSASVPSEAPLTTLDERAVRLFRCIFVVATFSLGGLSLLTLSPTGYMVNEGVTAKAQRAFYATANTFHFIAALSWAQLAAKAMVSGAVAVSARAEEQTASTTRSLFALPLYVGLLVLICTTA